MSSKIYFADSRTQFTRHLVHGLTEAYRFIRPKTAERQLRRLLLTPQKREPAAIPNGFETHQTSTPFGTLTSYTIGRGPTILFLHGWSGSGGQFFDLMKAVANHGYRAMTFDQYKHGRSSGAESNLPLFLRGIDFILEEFAGANELFCIVGHSMGCTAALDKFQQQRYPLFMISPVLNFFNELKLRVLGAGISNSFFEKMMHSIEKDYDFNLQACDPIQQIRSIQSPITIVHSTEDKFARHEFSQQAANDCPNIQLHSLEGLGHMRIIQSKATEEALLHFLDAYA